MELFIHFHSTESLGLLHVYKVVPLFNKLEQFTHQLLFFTPGRGVMERGVVERERAGRRMETAESGLEGSHRETGLERGLGV